jgi:hypothetical protein
MYENLIRKMKKYFLTISQMPRKRPKYKIVDYEPDKNFDFTDWFNQIET